MRPEAPEATMSCCGGFAMPETFVVQPEARRPRENWRLTGKHVLIGMVAFFLVIGGVNGFMMYAAISTMPGLDGGRNGYDASQRYNGDIADAQAQAARGWRADAELTRSGDDVMARVTFRDAGGNPVSGLDVEMQLLHPTTRRLDQRTTLQAMSPGSYAAGLAPVNDGAWDVLISAGRDGKRLYQSRNRKIF
jgi:nitrogen fixation protein FixH